MKPKAFFRMQSGYFALLATAAIFGIFPVLTRMVGESLPVFFQSWTRALATGAILAGVSYGMTKRIPHIASGDWKWFALRAVLGAVGFVGIFIALINLSVNEVYMIYFTSYLIGGILAGVLFFNESISPIRLLSIVLAACGLWVVYGGRLVSNDSYLLWSAAAGVGYSGWSIIPKKLVGKYSDLELNYLDMLLFSVVLFVCSVVAREVWIVPASQTVWTGTIGLALVWVVTGLTIIYGFARVDASLGSIVMLSEIPFALLVAYMVYAEQLTPSQLLGACIIFAAIAIPELTAWLRQRKK